MCSVWFRRAFVRLLKFLQIKEGRTNFWGKPILQKVWIIWSPLVSFNFNSFKDPNFSSFIRFQCNLYESGVPFSDIWNFCKLKRDDLISRGKQFCRKSELFGAPFCLSILKVLCTKILHHSADFNTFWWLRSTFLRLLNFLQIKDWGPNF